MGKSYGLCDLRIGKVGNLVFRKVENKNVISEKPKYYPVNSAWLTREEFKQYVLSLLDVGIPQLYLLDELPEEIYPYGLVFIQNDNATGVYLDKDGVRTHLQLGGGGGIDYVAQDPIAIDQLTRRISLKMGTGLHLDDEGRLVAEGEGGTYTAQLPITIDPETKTVGINLGLAFTVADEQLVLNLATDHGLGYLHDTLFLVTKDPITVDNAGIGVKTGDNLIVTQQGKLDVELHCGPGLRWDNTKTTYQEDTLRLRLGSVVSGSSTIEVTPSVDGDNITINALRYNTQASWNEQKEDDANLLGSGIIKKNVDSKVSKAGVQAPLSVNANDELVLGVGSGLELGDYGQNLQVRLGTGLKLDGTYHVEADMDYLKTEINKVEYRKGNTAFIYNSSSSAGLTISGDYNSNTPRTLLVTGQLCHLNFTLKGSSASYGANWTYLGRVPDVYKPAYQCTVVGMVYNGTYNDSCGGYMSTDGWVVVWTDPKPSTNNYQIRVAVTYIKS